jgi:hypothetical protein
MRHLDAFLSAYDPSDLPGASIDPLGFERGYLFLADKILPALTNVAAVPRYFSMLCAGTSLSTIDPAAPPRKQREARRDTAMRLERLWGLANYLVAQRNGLPLNGLRGVRYIAAEADRLTRAGEKDADPDYKLLSRQAPYGVLGIYGAVAEELLFFADRSAAMVLSPDAGARLADAFRDETKLPASVRKAVIGEGTVTIETLARWGESAYLAGQYGREEATCLHDALYRDPVRARMCALLAMRPFAGDGEPEQSRLRAIADSIAGDPNNADLHDALEIILAYEECYAWAMLAFERLLHLCRDATARVPDETRRKDGVLRHVADRLPAAVADLETKFKAQREAHVGAHPDQLADVRQFLSRAAVASADARALSDEVLTRHMDVQHGKFDRGRRKLPWIDREPDGIALTVTRVGGLSFEATGRTDIRPHFYRLTAADAFIAAGGAHET